MTASVLDFPGATATELGGLRGESLTGFLAALGALRLLTEAGEPVRLGWRPETPHHAVLACSLAAGPPLEERVAAALERRLAALDPFPGVMKLKDVPLDAYRAAMAAAMAREDRFAADLLSTLGSDAACRHNSDPEVDNQAAGQSKAKGQAGKVKGGGMLDPAWCVMDGAQQRNLFAAFRRFQEIARPRTRRRVDARDNGYLAGRVRSVLFGPWQEEDDKASLYLEPSLREHAYRWTNPLNDPARFDALANLLALVGLSLLPAVPVERGGVVALQSACCRVQKGGRASVSWPLWRGTIGLGTARRLLLLPELTEKEPPANLGGYGIDTVYRADAYPLEKGAKTYSQPQPIWRVLMQSPVGLNGFALEEVS